MRITHEADYAIRLVYVLLTEPETVVPASRLSEKAGVSLRFTLKILRKLSQEHIVTASKGASGGYSLAKEASQLSLGEIIESIDGPFELNHCLSDEFDCSRVGDKGSCAFHHIFDDLNARLRTELYSITMDQFQNQE